MDDTLNDKLSELDLEGYATMLEDNIKQTQGEDPGKLRLRLQHMKAELRFPFRDRREPLTSMLPKRDALFTALTGESLESLPRHLPVVATVTGTDDFGVKVKLTSQGGLMGQIKKQDINESDLNVFNGDLDKMFRVGQAVSAVISVVDVERIKVNVSVKDEAMDAGVAIIVMGAQNPYVPGFGHLKDRPSLLSSGAYSAIAHWQVLDGTFDVDAAVKDYETVRALQRQRQPKALDASQQRRILYVGHSLYPTDSSHAQLITHHPPSTTTLLTLPYPTLPTRPPHLHQVRQRD